MKSTNSVAACGCGGWALRLMQPELVGTSSIGTQLAGEPRSAETMA